MTPPARGPAANRKPTRRSPPREVSVEREARAWELRQQLWTQERIARELGITQQAVCAILKRVEQRTFADLRDRVEEHKARQTAQLEGMADEAYQAFLRSCEPTVTVKRYRRDDADVEEVTTKSNAGDASKLAEARNCLADIRKIWGIDARPNEQAAASETIDPDIAEVAIAAALAAQAAKRKSGQA